MVAGPVPSESFAEDAGWRRCASLYEAIRSADDRRALDACRDSVADFEADILLAGGREVGLRLVEILRSEAKRRALQMRVSRGKPERPDLRGELMRDLARLRTEREILERHANGSARNPWVAETLAASLEFSIGLVESGVRQLRERTPSGGDNAPSEQEAAPPDLLDEAQAEVAQAKTVAQRNRE
ncbi:MAG: hypothetical protein V1774_03515 [Candidatus Eisenbacteria bacterium]